MSHNFGLTSASKAGCWIRSTPFFIRKFSTNVDSLLPSPYKHHGTHPIPNRPPTSFTPFSGNSTSESHAQTYEIPNAATPTFGSISSALTITSNSSWKRHHLLLSPELRLYYQSPQLPWSIYLVGCHPTPATASKLRLRGIDFLLNVHSAATLWQISATSTPLWWDVIQLLRPNGPPPSSTAVLWTPCSEPPERETVWKAAEQNIRHPILKSGNA